MPFFKTLLPTTEKTFLSFPRKSHIHCFYRYTFNLYLNIFVLNMFSNFIYSNPTIQGLFKVHFPCWSARKFIINGPIWNLRLQKFNSSESIFRKKCERYRVLWRGPNRGHILKKMHILTKSKLSCNNSLMPAANKGIIQISTIYFVNFAWWIHYSF